jgi:hypothetical protein
MAMNGTLTSTNRSLGNYYMFYNSSALLSDKDKEFGTVIVESKNRLIVVDDEIKRDHVYLIPKAKIDYHSDKQLYFNIPESSLKDFELQLVASNSDTG